MKKIYAALLFSMIVVVTGAQTACPVIPAPAKATVTNSSFVLNKYTRIYVGDASLNDAATYLQQELMKKELLPLGLATGVPGQNTILLVLSKKNIEGDEGYTLGIKDKAISIVGNSVGGVVNGISSLLQLIRVQKNNSGTIAIAGWQISDAPRYRWRGFMLDESRHFMGKQKVLQLLDWMAFYKLNRFHWHLTDEPAWRLEIKRYPRLALLGSVGSFTDPLAAAAYYTQQDIADVVHYAAQRNITVVPEIDMPGHATAANRAYPEFSGGGNDQHPDFTFDPGNARTYTYLTNILREVNMLFPSGMIHLGGDEVSFGTDKWLQNEGIKQLMEAHSLKDLKAVERYFMERMADSVYSMDAKLLAWDEMAEVNLPREKTIIFWWRHDKPAQLKMALEKGYDVVVCPRLPYYFDFVQDSLHRMGRKWGKGYSPLKDVYSYEVASLVNEQQMKQVQGLQANLWTETVTNFNRMDYLVFPRIAALAEAAWTKESLKNYEDFTGRLKKQLGLYRDADIYFYNPFNPSEIPEPVYFRKDKRNLSAQEN
ncbi:beta-N-acetylhexosaminidase [Niabella drilacis]|uniref:beta-N-acetylhexosaminidase n=1 Tax=Niabella drilacis (strain DSM 25811 / CCM 8410 / CCUG 62505 / LMG 26954 / E90) TaxID=1285928 RepID=A0A1G6SZS1_NIADE|nr:beta-N-acetylhexosaminidase [Niabella drilacis]SDD21717.1 hexosaminidase [Niabella drilacis]